MSPGALLNGAAARGGAHRETKKTSLRRNALPVLDGYRMTNPIDALQKWNPPRSRLRSFVVLLSSTVRK